MSFYGITVSCSDKIDILPLALGNSCACLNNSKRDQRKNKKYRFKKL